MTPESDAAEKGAELLRQIAELREKLDDILGKPLDKKRAVVFKYISRRLNQITAAAIKASRNEPA